MHTDLFAVYGNKLKDNSREARSHLAEYSRQGMAAQEKVRDKEKSTGAKQKKKVSCYLGLNSTGNRA